MKFTMGLRVIIAGQKYFGAEVLRLCLQLKCEVAAVCCPINDKYIGRLATINGIPIIPAGSLNADTMPEDIDLGIAAHSFDFIGKRTRYKAKIGWIGYHPSLLPRHRGKSSVEWAIRMRDAITGGTVYWLNSGLDRGDIAYQDWCFIDPKLQIKKPAEAASELWRETLLDMGLRLFSKAINDIQKGTIIRQPQDDRFATFEPSTELEQIFKPDLLMLESRQSKKLTINT
jgi:methionyl-tRNA formyltransferase